MRLSKFLLLIFLIFSSCIESFVPETSDYDDVLFIEAQLTDDPSIPPHVIISKTISVTSDEPPVMARNNSMVSGATVTIDCDDGSDYSFFEAEPGRYIPVDPLFIGLVGNSYKITVLAEGETYESAYEYLSPSPQVDSLTSKVARQKTTDTGAEVYGLQFYANTHDDETEPTYYRWMLDATYKYDVPLFSTHRWINGRTVWWENSILRHCYKDINILGIHVSSTEGLEQNVIREAPLHFESQYGDELSILYCLHARQLKISESAYKFWSDLRKLIYETGGLYETQPFSIKGNIECTSDPAKISIGVFEVAGVSERRDYFSKPEEFELIRLYCKLQPVLSSGEGITWSDLKEGDFLHEDEPGSFSTGKIECFDCQERGGILTKPPFWEY